MLVYTESGATFAVCSLPGNLSAYKADSYWSQLNLTPYGSCDALNVSTGLCIKQYQYHERILYLKQPLLPDLLKNAKG